jgi:hypothetical protein
MSKTRTGRNSETVLVLDNGVEIRSFSETHQAGDYVSVTKDGVELGYWDCLEWKEAPVEVMGAILRCAALGERPERWA